jgi:DHA1 family inner membrane transport protein
MIAAIVAIVLPREFTDTTRIAGSPSNHGVSKDPLWSRNLMLSAGSFGLVGIAFFSYGSLYASYVHAALGFSLMNAGAALGMYGIGAMCAVVGGWLGDRMSTKSAGIALLVLATVGYMLFCGFEQFWPHLGLSFTFGLMVSGFLFARLMCLVQGSSHPIHIGHAGAGHADGVLSSFAGYLFGRLVETLGWSTASLFMVVGPPVIGFVLINFYDYSKMRTH